MKNFYDKHNHWDEDKHQRVLEEKREKLEYRKLMKQYEEYSKRLDEELKDIFPDASYLGQHRAYRINNQKCEEIRSGQFGVEFPEGTHLQMNGDWTNMPIRDMDGTIVGETSRVWFNGKDIMFSGWTDKEFDRYEAESSIFDIQEGVLRLSIVAIVGKILDNQE